MERDQQDTLGARLQRAVDHVSAAADARLGGAVLLGIALGAGVVVGGIVVFVVVWAVLVGFFA